MYIPFGSGILSIIHDTYFVLTASHVVENVLIPLYIRIEREVFIEITGKIVYSDIHKSLGIDLAYIKIDKLSNHNLYLDGLNYCVLGFPEKNIKSNFGIIETGASYILTSASNNNPYKYYKLNRNIFFLLDLKGKGTDIKSGKKIKVDTDLYGISGCGVWYIIYNLDPKTNQFRLDYRLVGLVTSHRKGKYFCLVSNKIHLLLEAMTLHENFKFR